MKRAIVTGARGFIGKRLVDELKSRGCEVAEIDMGDNADELSGEWDVMFNLAWVGKGGALRADYNVQMANVKLGLDFYRQAQRLKCGRYVCTGTIGEKMSRLPECSHIKSQNLIYAISKNYLHDILNTIGDESCQVVWATLGNIYGSKDAGGNIVDYCLRKILVGDKAEFGPAEQPYDFIHVDDVVRAIAEIGLGDAVKSSEFYVGSGTPKPLKEYLMEIGNLAGRLDLIGIGSRKDDGTRYRAEWFDISALREECLFGPRISFAEGIKGNIDSLSAVCRGDRS